MYAGRAERKIVKSPRTGRSIEPMDAGWKETFPARRPVTQLRCALPAAGAAGGGTSDDTMHPSSVIPITMMIMEELTREQGGSGAPTW